jgi:2-dehydro-3-deoxygluconokinase
MFLAFGEVMARIAAPQRLRWPQAVPGTVDVTWGGGEANVSASLAIFGQPVRYLTALPTHPLAEGITTSLRGLGVDVNHVLWRETGRMGIYFVEVGSNQRGSTVLYDREYSAVSLAEPDEYDWDQVLDGVSWVHVTGITPAISAAACRSNLELVRRAKQQGIQVSCDLNFRKKLWLWGEQVTGRDLARKCMSEVMPWVDVVIGNEEDAGEVLDIHAADTDVEQGKLRIDAYEKVARSVVKQYPNVSKVAITLRESLSADHNNWGGLLYDAAADRSWLAPTDAEGVYRSYQIHQIVDRVGAGDSFAAGLLHALNSPQWADPSQAIQFAVAASCLKHSIKGDFNFVTEREVAALVAGNATGRVQR